MSSNLDIRRWPLVLTIVVAIRLWVLNFSLELDYFYFQHSVVNVIERRINFCRIRDGAISSSGLTGLRCGTHKFFYFCMIEMSPFHITASSVGFPATESPSNDRWGEEGSNYSSCQPPSFVQMWVPFWIGEPTDQFELHTIWVSVSATCHHSFFSDRQNRLFSGTSE
jgi:hypothetical protein